jgi:hypothetical protein
MTTAETVRAVLSPLHAACVAFRAGELGERELIAISLAVNEELIATQTDLSARAIAKVFALDARERLLARVAELDREVT